MPKKLLFTIGLPFSGKSTLAARYAEMGWEVINRDGLLREIDASPEFHREVAEAVSRSGASGPEATFAVKNEIASRLLSEAVRGRVAASSSENIFYDGTNLQAALRKDLGSLREEGVDVEGVYLRVPVDELLERARRSYASGERLGQMNEGAFGNLVRMASMFEEPTEAEGYRLTCYDGRDEAKSELRFR